jgi:serine/threonine protein kinase
MLTVDWRWNDSSQHSARRRVFNVPEFKRLAAAAVDRKVEDVVRFEKLAEGGFNRTFVITMRDGFQFVGRIPYPVTEPKRLVIASEVATMDFLRSHGIPVPKVYSYSATPENVAGTEYLFMELVSGTNLGDIWHDLPEKARIRVVKNIVEMESRLFSLSFPASGSLFYTKDLPAGLNRIDVPIADYARDARFCVGPDTRLGLWYGRRLDLQIDRGPRTYQPTYSQLLHLFTTLTVHPTDTDPVAALQAGAKKEIAYLTRFGQPLHPFRRLRREIYNYQKQLPSEHLDNLEKYLRVAPFLIPDGNKTLSRPTLRHADVQPNNVFISDDLGITSLIDWQHCSILPLFLQCAIPNSFQNYGDAVSESLERPELPSHSDELSDRE